MAATGSIIYLFFWVKMRYYLTTKIENKFKKITFKLTIIQRSYKYDSTSLF